MGREDTGNDSPLNGSTKAFAIVVSTLACLFALLYFTYREPSPVDVSSIRVRNETGSPLHGVTVNGVTYGDIAAGGSTGYRDMSGAYRYASLSVVMSGTKIDLRPHDYVGETPLGEGRFTYRIIKLTGNDGATVDIRAVKDAD